MNDTFEVDLAHDMAWTIKRSLCPGPDIPGIRIPGQDEVKELRHKVNEALLRFSVESDLVVVPITINENEGWLIDQSIAYDQDGNGTRLLLQVYKGLWELRYGLPTVDVPEGSDRAFPKQLDDLRERGRNG